MGQSLYQHCWLLCNKSQMSGQVEAQVCKMHEYWHIHSDDNCLVARCVGSVDKPFSQCCIVMAVYRVGTTSSIEMVVEKPSVMPAPSLEQA